MCRRGTAHLVLWSWHNWQSSYRKRVWSNIIMIIFMHNLLMQRGNSVCNISPRHLKLSLSIDIVDAVFWSIFPNISSPSTRLLSNQWSRQNMWGLKVTCNTVQLPGASQIVTPGWPQPDHRPLATCLAHCQPLMRGVRDVRTRVYYLLITFPLILHPEC